MSIQTGFVIGLLALSVASSALADIQPVVSGSREDQVAGVASQIFSVSNFKIASTAYQIVAMDSSLNGDIAQTTILLVGQGEVGGAAGYEAAFVLTPRGDLRAMQTARAERGAIGITFWTMSGSVVKKRYRYDTASKVLKETDAAMK